MPQRRSSSAERASRSIGEEAHQAELRRALGDRAERRVLCELREQDGELLVLIEGEVVGHLSDRVGPRYLPMCRNALQTIDLTVDERGLAGLLDLAGLAWRMDMGVFFEAWVEAIVEVVARRVGARLRVGRREETRVPLDWTPPASGSQRSAPNRPGPRARLRRGDIVVVLDAKFKRHAEEIERLGWAHADERLREQHRNDVLQALAYSTLFDAPRVVACLVYPAAPSTWPELVARGRVASRARVRSGSRHVELALIAVPFSGEREQRLPRSNVSSSSRGDC